MDVQIIVAIISGSAVIIAAIIAGIFKVFSSREKKVSIKKDIPTGKKERPFVNLPEEKEPIEFPRKTNSKRFQRDIAFAANLQRNSPTSDEISISKYNLKKQR